MKQKYIIAGGRDFKYRPILYKVMDNYKFLISEVVSGDAIGADSLGAEWASVNSIPVKHFPAEWDKYGKSAGFIRNAEMGEYADIAICFWDGKSKGTKHMIDTMKRAGKLCYVYNYNGEISATYNLYSS